MCHRCVDGGTDNISGVAVLQICERSKVIWIVFLMRDKTIPSKHFTTMSLQLQSLLLLALFDRSSGPYLRFL